MCSTFFFFFFQAEDGIRDYKVTGVQTCALPIYFQECVAGGVLFSVATARAAVAGYVVAHHAADEGEILNLAVTPLHRRRGLGRALVRHVLGRLARRMVKIVFLEARQADTAARRLYESLGFVGVGRRPGYYRRPLEDAVILRVTLAPVADL